jgi:hypothetical protein
MRAAVSHAPSQIQVDYVGLAWFWAAAAQRSSRQRVDQLSSFFNVYLLYRLLIKHDKADKVFRDASS